MSEQQEQHEHVFFLTDDGKYLVCICGAILDADEVYGPSFWDDL